MGIYLEKKATIQEAGQQTVSYRITKTRQKKDEEQGKV